MSLFEQWQKIAYNQNQSQAELQKFWQRYFILEKGIYEKLLDEPDTEVKGTVKDLANKFGIEVLPMIGFLDGINESLVKANDLDSLEEDSEVSLKFDKALLYKNMVDAKADWLYELPQWKNIFDDDTRKRLFKEARSLHTIIRTEKKIGRNDPCPCGSGKKYKFCCGKH